jgi:uncharacterized repeat protein (TIGR02543 family)
MKSFANGPRSARYTILGLLGAVLALFAACDVAGLDAIGKSGEPSSDAVTLRVALEGAAPRTIGPELPAIARYELVTWLADESLKILGSWEDLAEANVAIEPGVWDFALTAYDVFGRPLLTGMLLDRAVIGPGTLSFALSDTKQGTGSVSLRVSFPASSGIVEAWASFDGDETELGILDDAAPGMRYVRFEASAPSDDYGLVISFHDATGRLLSSVVELAKIRDNMTSRKSVALSASDIASAPAPLASLSASPALGVKGVTLNWAYAPGAVNTAEGYRVYRRLANAPASSAALIFTVDGGTSFSATDADPDLATDAEYAYFVVPENNYGFDLASASPVAQSRPCLEVAFDSRGGSAVAASYVPKGQALADLPAAPTKAGAVFVGWYRAPLAGDDEVTAATTVSAGMTAYARWQRAISFLPNGGAEAAYGQNALEGIAEALDPCAFTRAGYSFAGWALSPYEAIAYSDAASITIAEEAPVLYARWIVLDANPASDFVYTVAAGEVTITDYQGFGTGEDYTTLIPYDIKVPELIDGLPVSAIGERAFAELNGLINIDLGEARTLGEFAFSGCQFLETVTWSERITELPNYCFDFCLRLRSIDLHEGITRIGEGAIWTNSQNMVSLGIPSTVVEIGFAGIGAMANLTSFTFYGETPPSLGIGALQYVHADCLIYVPAGSVDAYKAAPGWADVAGAVRPIP